MTIFNLYLKLGIDHIMDFKGYDHILFILALCSVYKINEWKRIVILVSAFTIGHSLTLVLATLKIVNFSTSVIEFLIPLTIFLTALFNAINSGKTVGKALYLSKYIAALFFGLIHGLGFSNYLRSLLGAEESIITPLFGFNIGIELGQLIIITCILLITWIFVNLFKVPRRDWNLILAGGALGISLILMLDRIPW